MPGKNGHCRTIHCQLQPVTNCDQLLLPQVDLMVAILLLPHGAASFVHPLLCSSYHALSLHLSLSLSLSSSLLVPVCLSDVVSCVQQLPPSCSS